MAQEQPLYSPKVLASLANAELERGLQLERGLWATAVADTVDVEPVTAEQAAFLGVRGAALAVLRRQVHRRMEAIVAGKDKPAILPARERGWPAHRARR